MPKLKPIWDVHPATLTLIDLTINYRSFIGSGMIHSSNPGNSADIPAFFESVICNPDADIGTRMQAGFFLAATGNPARMRNFAGMIKNITAPVSAPVHRIILSDGWMRAAEQSDGKEVPPGSWDLLPVIAESFPEPASMMEKPVIPPAPLPIPPIPPFGKNKRHQSYFALPDQDEDSGEDDWGIISNNPPTESPSRIILQEPPVHQVLAANIPCNDKHIFRDLIRKLQSHLPLTLAKHPGNIRAELLAEFSWFSGPIDYFCQRIADCDHDHASALLLSPVLLVGSPGCGKTSFLTKLAEVCGVPFRLLGMAAMGDARTLLGTPAGYSSATPCLALQTISETGVPNPFIILDEIEKSSGRGYGGNGGNPHEALLNFLDPANARHHLDPAVERMADLSRISWLATANSLKGLDRPLLSRMQVLHVSGPSAEHLDGLVRRICRDRFPQADAAAIADQLRPVYAGKRDIDLRHLKRFVGKLASGDRVNESIPTLH